MKAAPFEYVRARSLGDVFRWYGSGDARLLAGGQSLVPALAFRLSEPRLLIDITRVTELVGLTALADGCVRVGALTTHTMLGTAPLLRERVPLLAEAVPLIAHPSIRNRGTLGGSLALADPAAELPAVCIALGATIIAIGPSLAERRIPAARFFTGLFTTVLAANELILAVEFPSRGPDERTAIVEIARRSGDYAMAGVAARSAAGIDPVLVYFGIGDTPVLARAAAAALGSGPWSPERIAAAQAELDRDIDPPGDQHGGPRMKRHLARVLLGRALARLCMPVTEGAA